MEPTYVHYVRATHENPQSAGLAAGQFLKVKLESSNVPRATLPRML